MNEKTMEERFWAKVDKSAGPVACWEWRGSKKRGGYGTLWVDNHCRAAHRISWEMAHGAIPPAPGYHGTCVCHHCDNPSCVNPSHLFLGTSLDNSADRVRKGRAVAPCRGKWKYGKSKLSASDVQEIREAHAHRTASNCLLAERYGVTPGTIGHVVRRLTWRHLK